MDNKLPERKPGRPRAIPPDKVDFVMGLYRNGLGYRAIVHELENEGIFTTHSTVRRLIKEKIKSESENNIEF